MHTAFYPRKFSCILLALILCISALPCAAAETEPLSEPTAVTETFPQETCPTDPTAEDGSADAEEGYEFFCPYNLYFGLLHAHTEISDGLGSVEEAFSLASRTEGMDFFAVTDHSNSFDNALSGEIGTDGSSVSAEWAAGKAAAEAVTTETFLGIFGFEMTWPEIRQLGHITTFATPGWISRDQDGFSDDADALDHYFQALSTVPQSVSQFCHPGDLYGDFGGFSHYRWEYDDTVQLLETLGEGSIAAYIQALDRFWHLAPTASQNIHNGRHGSENDLRTVILAEELTEQSLFDAIRAHRVYATQDKDLHLYYTLEGYDMGSRLPYAEDPELILSLWDPTDAGCTAEIIGTGGITLARKTLEGNGDLIFRLPEGYRWYFVKITQPDGDVAVTAPVWVEDFEDMGIARITADREVPIQNGELTLFVALYNNESVDMDLTELELYADDTLIGKEALSHTLGRNSTLVHSIPYTHSQYGAVTLRVLVRGRVLGKECCLEGSVDLRFRPSETVSGLLIDGSHNNLGLDSLENLRTLARESATEVTLFTDLMPQGGEILLIPPMESPADDGFAADVRAFLENGGTVILLGRPSDNVCGNTLLEALGSSIRFGDLHLEEGSSTCFDRENPLWDTLSENQFLRYASGTNLECGRSRWLAKDSTGDHVILAVEELTSGGRILAAGNPFLSDEVMPLPQSVWQLPRANQTLFQAILGSARRLPAETSLLEARTAPAGSICRIKGYVTAGTADPGTMFADTIYLQDDTAGIAVTGFTAPDIPIGAPMEIIGVRDTQGENPVLVCTDFRIRGESYYYFTPQTIGCKTAVDYSLRGGQLVQVEGTVTALTKTDDGLGICRLTLRDTAGTTAVIEIEDGILSGSTNRNTLAKTIRKGRSVRIIGLVHINENGQTVIRVRDCDEVVYIPPEADLSNPKTADTAWVFP